MRFISHRTDLSSYRVPKSQRRRVRQFAECVVMHGLRMIIVGSVANEAAKVKVTQSAQSLSSDRLQKPEPLKRTSKKGERSESEVLAYVCAKGRWHRKAAASLPLVRTWRLISANYLLCEHQNVGANALCNGTKRRIDLS